MAERIGEQGVRVRYAWTRLGAATAAGAPAKALARGLEALDDAGLCPTLDDGLSAGNAAVRDGRGLWISPSGRTPRTRTTHGHEKSGSPLNAASMVHVVDFSPTQWAGRGHCEANVQPSSDLPLHWAALIEGPRACGWTETPSVALHGHALDTDAHAQALGVPISREETLFSTPEDRAALLEIMRTYPYPAHRLWIRRGHGFFLVGPDFEKTLVDLTELRRALAAL